MRSQATPRFGDSCEVRVYYEHDGMAYEVRRNRKRVGERRRAPEAHYSDIQFAHQLITAMKASGKLL